MTQARRRRRPIVAIDLVEAVVHYAVAVLLLAIATIVLYRTGVHLVENRHQFAFVGPPAAVCVNGHFASVDTSCSFVQINYDERRTHPGFPIRAIAASIKILAFGNVG